MAHTGTELVTRDQLAEILPPAPTDTHKPIAHSLLVNSIIESLSFRHINVVKEQFAVSPDGMKLFGCLDLETLGDGFRFALGLRNANDRSMRLGLVVGIKVFCCDNMAFQGDFAPVLAKHSKHFDLNAALAIGMEQIQRNFKPLANQIEHWRQSQINDDFARAVICKAFFEDALEAPKHLGKIVYNEYFNPTLPDFAPRTKWSLNNAFTSAFKQLDPIPMYRATASLGQFFQRN